MGEAETNHWLVKPLHEERGLVLSVVPHADRGQVAKVFFQENGIRSVYLKRAKGAARFQKEETGTILAPSLASLSFKIKSLDSMPKVDSCVVEESFLGLGHDPVQWGRAGYLLEICEQLLPSAHPEQDVFDMLVEALGLLARGKADGVLLRAFELRLLKTQGYLGDSEEHLAGAALDYFEVLMTAPFAALPTLDREIQRDLARPFWAQRKALGLKPTKSAQFLKQFQRN